MKPNLNFNPKKALKYIIFSTIIFFTLNFIFVSYDANYFLNMLANPIISIVMGILLSVKFSEADCVDVKNNFFMQYVNKYLFTLFILIVFSFVYGEITKDGKIVSMIFSNQDIGMTIDTPRLLIHRIFLAVAMGTPFARLFIGYCTLGYFSYSINQCRREVYKIKPQNT